MMQSVWGPRIFWLVVFILAGLGIYVYFADPADDDNLRIGFSAPLANMVSIHPQVAGIDIYLGMNDREPTLWKGDVKLGKGKVLQLYPRKADPSSVLSGTRFECSTQIVNGKIQPVVLHVVYQADPDDTLTLKVNKDSQHIALSDLRSGKHTLEAQGSAIKITASQPVQIYENDSALDDHHPRFIHDTSGGQYLLYMNSERSKGIDVNSVLAGSFESLEGPILGTTLRLARFSEGNWQYSEAITSKLETCAEAVAAIDATGRMYVAWLQKSIEGWDIYFQFKDYGTKGDSSLSWSKPAKLTAKPGSYQQLVAGTDSKGKVWLAWQSWLQDHNDIYAVVLNDDKHFMKTPGLVAEHPSDIDGRWFPAMAADKLGNMYLAWSVFRQGRFDIEMVKLHENMIKVSPTQFVTSAKHALRPSLSCDQDNNVWVAYEESEPGKQFGDLSFPSTTIRVRTLRSDKSIDEWPAIPVPEDHRQSEAKSIATPQRCIHPRMLVTQEGLPIIAFEAYQALHYVRWKDNGWSPPRLLSQWNADLAAPGGALYQAGHVVGVHECIDWKGRVRLQFAAASEVSAAPTMVRQPAPTPQIDTMAWKQFSESARLFRRRSDDLVLSKQYLLRGMVALPNALPELAIDPWGASSLAYEQSLYDWFVVPYSSTTPTIEQWHTAQRAQILTSQGDRSILVGYYRPLMGQREPMLLIDGKKDELPLAPLGQLESLRRISDRDSRINVSQAADRTMISQYLTQRNRLGFSLNDDWKMLAMLTQPGTSDAYGNDSIEKVSLPLWHPEAIPGSKPPLGMRVVAYANGKSYDHLLSALTNRHFYTATDDIYLIVRCERHLPGDVFQTAFRPSINVTVQGTSKIKHVEIWQDNQLVKSEDPPGMAAILEFIYDKADRQWHSYTVRVVQENGAVAIIQPFWIKYLP